MAKKPIFIVSEYPGRTTTELPRDVAEVWSGWHEGTKPKDAPNFAVFEDEDGAYVCECCGVNYNPAVDKD